MLLCNESVLDTNQLPDFPIGVCLGGCRGNDSDDIAVLITQKKKLAVRDCWLDCMHD